MKRRTSSSESGSHKGGSGSHDSVDNIRTKPPRIFDNITRRLLQLGVTLAITTFLGLIVRYAVQEFDPSVSTITVTTSRVNNRDIASLSVSKNFLEKILEFVEESIAIVASIIPIGFPLCTIFNRYFAKIRAGSDKIEIKSNAVLNMIPKYVVIGDAQACQMPNSTRLRPLVRDTIYHLIRARLKPKLIVEDSYDEARRLGIRIGLIRREHHKLAVIKSVDLLKNITDSRGDIKQGKVRYLLSRMKIMSQSTPADKSLLIYLMKHCEPMPNENLAYLGYSFTDPEAMKLADCAITFLDCDDDDVKNSTQVLLKSANMNFTDIYLFIVVCLITSNITQSYALYQISASVSCCLYRFLSITVFREQLISHSQFMLLIIIQQVFAMFALMTKWLSSLPQEPLRSSIAEMSHTVTEDSFAAAAVGGTSGSNYRSKPSHHRSNTTSISGNGESGSPHREHKHQQQQQQQQLEHEPVGATSIRMDRIGAADDTLGSSSLEESDSSGDLHNNVVDVGGVNGEGYENGDSLGRVRSRSNLSHSRSGDSALGGASYQHHRQQQQQQQQQQQHRRRQRRNRVADSSQHIHLSGTDLDEAVINSKLATTYKQTFHNSAHIDDVTYRLAKLHIAYQLLVMIIIMIFGNTMFQLNSNDSRQHQTLAFNSLIMNNIFNLANCFNQFGDINLRSGFKNHPFFVCVIIMSVVVQVSLTELNAFGLENLNPLQWFVCLVFALLSALIAPLTGQQRRHRRGNEHQLETMRHQQLHHQQQQYIHQKHHQASSSTTLASHHRHHKPTSSKSLNSPSKVAH